MSRSVQPNPLNRPHWLGRTPSQLELVFFDLETTGGNPDNSDVIEIAAIKYKMGREVGRYQSLVNPRRPIPRTVRQITGIDNAMVRDAPTIHDVIDDVLAFIGDAVLVSHGVLNDYAFIANYARTLRKIDLTNYYICTHLLVSNFMPEMPGKSLTAVAQYFGLLNPDAHRAMADAETTGKIFWEIQTLCERDGFHTLEDLLKIQADNQTLNRLGPGISPRDVERAPTTPGLLYLFNSNREIAYVSASQNIKRSLMSVTELSDEREFNRLIVDLADFRFDRTPHFLHALLREKRELKKLNLPIDPRKFEGRANGFVQVVIPEDMLAYANQHPEVSPFDMSGLGHGEIHWKAELANLDSEHMASSLRISQERGFISEEEEALVMGTGQSTSQIERARNQYAYQDAQRDEEEGIPIRQTRRVTSNVRTHKFQTQRSLAVGDGLSSGPLVEGIGWVFGPFESSKVTRRQFEELAVHWPFMDTSISMDIRFFYLQLFILTLHGQLDKEIDFLRAQKNSLKNLVRPVVRLRLVRMIEELEYVKSQKFALPRQHLLRSGLAVISNNDQKEIDIAIVVRGRVRKATSLPVEQSDKLKSSRFFTRLFHRYSEELSNPLAPVMFNEETCTDIELFSFWLAHRKHEGEWADFEDLEALYDPKLI